MKQDTTELFSALRPHYTPGEAKEAIDTILRPYGEDVYIVFRKSVAEIMASYKVDSLVDRHVICEIIARTGLTERTYEDLSAEWRFHNVAWDLHFKRESAKDVALDYNGDPRAAVRLATAVFDALDIE